VEIMTQRNISRKALMVFAALVIGSFAVTAALAQDDDAAPNAGLHDDLATIGDARVLLESGAPGRSGYRLIERDTKAGTCLALILGPGREAEACGFEGFPVIMLDDAQHGEQYLFGLTSPDTAEIEIDGKRAEASDALAVALRGRAQGFVIRVPGTARQRVVQLRDRTVRGVTARSQRFEFKGPRAGKFGSPAERDAEFDFHDR
jgi:hypothetical protein